MLHDMFERVYVINLPRRAERWEAFVQRLPADWPFRVPERYVAIDGGLATPPDWWKGGADFEGSARTLLHQSRSHCEKTRMEKENLLTDWCKIGKEI